MQQKEHIMRESNGNEAERQRRLKDLEAQKCNWDFVVSDHPSIKVSFLGCEISPTPALSLS